MTVTPSELQRMDEARQLLSDTLRAAGILLTSREQQFALTEMEIGLEHLRRRWTLECSDAAHVFVSPATHGRCVCGTWLIAVMER